MKPKDPIMRPSDLIPPRMSYIEKNGSLAKRCNWDKVAQSYIRFLKNALRKHKEPDTKFDLTDAMMSRRKRVAVSSVDGIIARYKDKPGLEEANKDDTGAAWLHLNFQPHVTYNSIEGVFHILCAAAIWILDQVTRQDGWEEKLYPLLPQDESLLMKVYTPEMWHADYETELIQSVLYVLYYRDADIAPIEMEDNDTYRVITNSLNARNAQHKDVASRRNFDALMELIPDRAKERAVQHYKEKLEMWVDRYFDYISSMNTSIHDAYDRCNQLADQYNAKLDQLTKIIMNVENGDKLPTVGKREINPLLVHPNISPDDISHLMSRPTTPSMSPGFMEERIIDQQGEVLFNLANQMSDMLNQHEQLIRDFNDLQNKASHFQFDIVRRGYIYPERCKRDYGMVVPGHLKPLSISDPYELCFALLWLVESGSDLPWLYGPGCGLMTEVVCCLPWAMNDYDKENDPVWQERNMGTEQLSFMDMPERTRAQKSSPIPDWYERSYATDEDEYQFNFNLAQLFYEETGCIMPRDLHQYDVRQKNLKACGVGAKDMRAMLLLCSALSHASRRRTVANLHGGLMHGDEDEAALFDSEAETTLTEEEWEQRLKQMRNENKRLRTSLHESERATREAQKELASVREEAALEHRELADLRELVFNQDSADGEESETEVVDVSAFPYEVRKETVVFGGHDNWLKVIRPQLTGNIRFVDKDLVFDTDIIRHADVIWIQTNVLSHKQYYRIVDVARRYHKQVRYFTQASAMKGAEEVMNADLTQ